MTGARSPSGSWQALATPEQCLSVLGRPYARSTLSVSDMRGHIVRRATITADHTGPWTIAWSADGNAVTFRAVLIHDRHWERQLADLMGSGLMTNDTGKAIATNDFEEEAFEWKAQIAEPTAAASPSVDRQKVDGQ